MSIHKQEYQFITTPHNVIKRFQNKKDMNVFEKKKQKHNQRLDIKLSCPQRIAKHLRKHMENMYRAR